MDKYNLVNEWGIWYHSINDNNWGKSSYRKLMTVRNLYDYKLLVDIFEQNHYQNGMFFCMKGDIVPMWEDPRNRNGGCLSFKVGSGSVITEWNRILFMCVTGQIMTKENENIHGISISPKKEFNIVKIWFKEDNYDKLKPLLTNLDEALTIDNALYKKHILS